jgi:hypothetical protein
MLEPLKSLSSLKIMKEEGTEGSAPLLILADDTNLYYAKTTLLNPPRVELINEIICCYFAKCWKINVPDSALITIDSEVLENFIKENGSLSARYKLEHFNLPFFASKQIWPLIELERYFNGLERKTDINKFYNPIDLIKIGVFDIWVGNKDRKPTNPNILLCNANDKILFYAIDHTAAFCFITDYKKVVTGK